MNQELSNESSHRMIEYDAVMQRLGGDEELFQEFVQIFLEDSPQYLKNFTAGLSSENLDQVRHAAHALKGLASNFGAREFCLAAQEIETTAKSGDLSVAQKQQGNLSELLKQLSAELNNYR